MKHALFFVTLLLLLNEQACDKVIYLSDYTQDVDCQVDATPAVRAALEACRSQHATKLVIEPGTYHFLPNLATEKYLFVSNNDEGLKRILFDLSDMKDFEVDGRGASFIFTGYITPFLLDHSEGITIKNLHIDYTRTFHSEGTIAQSGDGWLDIAFTKDYHPSIQNGCLYFEGPDGTSYPFANLLEFDSVRREPAFLASDYWLSRTTVPAQAQSDGTVRIFHPHLTGTVGNKLVFGAGHRRVPGFIVSDSQGVLLRDIDLYHCGGMGVIAQRSRDIEVNQMTIIPAANKDRIISITADATHFSNCSGYIKLINCTFTNQKDDATNIHGIYAAITDLDSTSRTMTVKYVHEQQYGFDFITPGTTLEFVNPKSIQTYYTGKVRSVERLNKEYARVVMEEDFPPQVAVSHAVASVDAYPNVLIQGCRFEKNRARGLLLGSRGPIVIENNYFHIGGAAILFEGDARYWYEQSGVRDVTIRGNTFDNGNYGYSNWGMACISVGTGVDQREETRYHRNIVITDNTFNVFDPRLLYLYCVDSLVFENNVVNTTTEYPNVDPTREPFVVQNSSNVRINGHSY